MQSQGKEQRKEALRTHSVQLREAVFGMPQEQVRDLNVMEW